LISLVEKEVANAEAGDSAPKGRRSRKSEGGDAAAPRKRKAATGTSTPLNGAGGEDDVDSSRASTPAAGPAPKKARK
jgi:hypothetical protein